MKRSIVAFILAAAAAAAQSSSTWAGPEAPLPRNPFLTPGPFKVIPPLRRHLRDQFGSNTIASCAIPLTFVPVNSGVDAGMKHKAKAFGDIDPMSPVRGLPVCGAHADHARSLAER